MRDSLLAALEFVRLCVIAGSFGAGAYVAFYALDSARDRVNAWRNRRAAVDRVIDESRELVKRP